MLSLAIIPRPRAVGGLELYQSETTGMKLRPSILGTARMIWKIYGLLTLVLIAFLFVGTLIILPDYGVSRSLFDAVNHAMTGIATGGFSTLDDSIAGYHSYSMEIIHLLPMIIGVVSIPLYYNFARERKLTVFWDDPQFRMMTWISIFGSLIMAILLIGNDHVADPLREGVFQVISGMSGCGWQTSDIGNWSGAAVLFLAFGTMVVGGAAGSTAGGFKLIRGYVLLRAIQWRVQKIFLPPAAVIPFRIGRKNMMTETMHREVSDAALISFLYLIVLCVSIIAVAALAPAPFTLGDAVFESVSAQGTVGLSSGITDPGMPVMIEVIFILQMWVGRLEVFPVIVLLQAFFMWIARR